MRTRRILTVILLAVVLMSGLRSMPASASTPMVEITARGKETLAGSESTSVLFIPAAAFNPKENGYEYEKDTALTHFHSSGGGADNGLYYAPVNLPHGAVVTDFTFYWYDYLDSSDGIATLKRSQLSNGNVDQMARAETEQKLQWHSSEDDDPVDYTTIDNLHYAYFVELDLPVSTAFPDQIIAFNVSIEYIPPVTNIGVLSIPAAAFTPHEDGYGYWNFGDSLRHTQNIPSGTSGWYYAPVELPYGSVVTKFTFYWYDDAIVNGKAILQRTLLATADYKDMATAVSAASPGIGSSYDDDIDYEKVDPAQCAYWVVWDLPESDIFNFLAARGVVIEYTIPTTPARILSIPAAAFSPSEDGVDFMNDGRYLRHNSGGSSSNGVYYAPVYLPQRASVLSIIFNWYDASDTGSAMARLGRSGVWGGTGYLMTAESVDQGGWGDTSTSEINYATIDNSQYSYLIELTLPEVEDVMGCAVRIEYGYRLYLPLAIK